MKILHAGWLRDGTWTGGTPAPPPDVMMQSEEKHSTVLPTWMRHSPLAKRDADSMGGSGSTTQALASTHVSAKLRRTSEKDDRGAMI